MDKFDKMDDTNSTYLFAHDAPIYKTVSNTMDSYRAINSSNTSSNSSKASFLDEDYFGYVLYSIVVPFLFGSVTLIGLVGNAMVIYVICTKNKMRTLTNLLLLNLAFADLSFVLICPPFTAYQLATFHWPFQGVFGDVICKLMHYLLNVTAYVTIYTLVLIAALRYFTIVHNSATVKYRNKKTILFLVIGVWVIMMLVNIPILLSYGVQTNRLGMGDCENYGTKVGQRLYATFFAFAYLLPLLIIAMFSLGILQHIHSSKAEYIRGTHVSKYRKKHASQLLIAVVVLFAIFWFPIHIHLILAYYTRLPSSDLYRTISVLFNFLAYFNSCINPFIYNVTSKDFRRSFREAMQCCNNRQTGSRVAGQKSDMQMNGNSQDMMLMLSNVNRKDNIATNAEKTSNPTLQQNILLLVSTSPL